MRKKKKTQFFLQEVIALITITILFANILQWHIVSIGVICSVILFVILGSYWKKIIGRFFRIKEQTLVTKLLGTFVPIWLLGTCMAIMVVWGTYHWIGFLGSIIGVLIASFLLARYSRRGKRSYIATEPFRFPKEYVFSRSFGVVLLYGVFWVITFFLLFQSRGTGVAFTPWQFVSPYVGWLFFVTLVLTGIIICSKQKGAVILGVLVAQSFLVHSLMPLSHELPWGGDVWRISAVESQLLAGEAVLPVLWGGDVIWRDIGPIHLPEALIIPHKYLYGHLWGTTIMFAELLQLNILTINIWLVPVLWSLFVPVLLYRLGRVLFSDQKMAFLFSGIVSFVPFTMQILGSLTLGGSLGFVGFLFGLLLLLHHLQQATKRTRTVAVIFGVLLVFSYTLYTIIYWILLLAVLGILVIEKESQRHTDKEFTYWKWVFALMGAMTAISFFPLLEWLSGSSKEIIASTTQLYHLIGQYSGGFFATLVRPHDIASWNIFINHTPAYAFISHPLNAFRWHIVLGMIMLSLGAAIGVFIWGRKKTRSVWALWGYFTALVLGGYVIGWFVLTGDRSFVRRLDPLVAITIITIAFYGIAGVLRGVPKLAPRVAQGMILLGILFTSWFASTVYTAGPDIRVMSTQEHDLASHLWGKRPSCVLADTWVLLALEEQSQGTVVGGGFPITEQFGQEERVLLYEQFKQGNVVESASFDVHEQCVVVLPQNDVSEEAKKNISSKLGPANNYDGYHIWKMDRSVSQ